jgi:hypothetical protein
MGSDAYLKTGETFSMTEEGGGAALGCINIGDSWKTVSEMYINIGDVWKAVSEAQINIGDAWKALAEV